MYNTEASDGFFSTTNLLLLISKFQQKLSCCSRARAFRACSLRSGHTTQHSIYFPFVEVMLFLMAERTLHAHNRGFCQLWWIEMRVTADYWREISSNKKFSIVYRCEISHFTFVIWFHIKELWRTKLSGRIGTSDISDVGTVMEFIFIKVFVSIIHQSSHHRGAWNKD